MKIEHLLTEHKKGVKAVKYAKKPQPIVGPEALKKKAKAKVTPPKTELQKHSKLTSELKEDADFQFDMKLAKILKNRGYKGPIKLEQLGMKWIEAVGNIVDIDDGIMVNGTDPEYDSWVAFVYEMGQYAYGAEQGYQTGNAKSVEKNTREHGVAEGPEDDIEDTRQFRNAIALAKSQKAIRQARYGKDQKFYADGTPVTPEEVARRAAERKAKKQGVAEGKIKVKIKHPPETAQEKLYKKHQELRKKSGLPDPEEYKKKAAEKQKEIDDMKEAKQPEAPKPRNFVAKNAKTAGAGVHKDAKKASKEVRGQKHKNKEIAEDSLAETYDQARAARIRYALMLRESDWDRQSDEMTPPEYDMDPEELKAIRNAEFTEEDKIQAMIKLAAGGTSDEDIAKIYDMDKETVSSILDDYIEEIEASMEPEDDVKEAEMGKVIDYKPGQTATIDTGPGMTTVVDLKKNPTSLTKNPDTGKLQLVSTPKTTAQPSATTQSTVKAGDQVEIGKTTEDLLRLAGLK